MSEPRLIGRSGSGDRSFYVATVTSMDDWPAGTHAIGRFVAFTALNATQASDEQLERLANRLIDAGCVYSCSWGPDAARVELAFDLAAIERGSPEREFLMTTAHEGESLDDALWYAVFTAWPADDVAPQAVLVVTADEWADEIETRLSRVEAWSAEVLERDGGDQS